MTRLPLSRMAVTRGELAGVERADLGRAREMVSRRRLRAVEAALVLYRQVSQRGVAEQRGSESRT